MSLELKIPALGESITEVQISEWLKGEGDVVKQDEAIAVIDSAKATVELPAPQGGRVSRILRQAGETVPVGAVVAELEPEGAADKAKPGTAETGFRNAKEASKAETKVAEQAEPSQTGAPEPKPEAAGKKPGKAVSKPDAPVPASEPAAEEMPSEAKAQTSAAGPKPASEREEEVVPMTMLRRTVARRLVEAQQTMAMLTTFNEADLSAVQALRKEFQEAFEKRYQVKLGLMSFFIKAAVDALNQFPQLNAEVRADDIVYHNYFDIGVAVASERGLVVPVLRHAEGMSFAEVEAGIGDFARRAKEGQLKPDELAGGTFTITNGGVFGSLLSTPIINPPQAGILGLHTIQERPVAVDGEVVIRPMMYLALTYDHRIVDGREAVLFLRRIKQLIENPARILIEI